MLLFICVTLVFNKQHLILAKFYVSNAVSLSNQSATKT